MQIALFVPESKMTAPVPFYKSANKILCMFKITVFLRFVMIGRNVILTVLPF